MPSLIDRLGARLLQNRRFVRTPIWLYQHKLGALMGSRILMLEHTGRSSGLPRYVCLEVVDRPSPDVIVIVSGFGESSQWYRNLQQNPACKVYRGGAKPVSATARMMSETESDATLKRYQQQHPQAWNRLRGMIEEAVGVPVTTLPMVSLHLDR